MGNGRPPRRPRPLLLRRSRPDLLLVGGVTVPPSNIRVHSSLPPPPSLRLKGPPSPRPKGLLLCGADGVGRRRRRHLLSVVIVVRRAIAVGVVVRRTVAVAIFVDVVVCCAVTIVVVGFPKTPTERRERH